MSNIIRVACVQMNSSAKLELNLQFVEQQLVEADKQQVKIVLLPENFAQMPARAKDQHVEYINQGEVQMFLGEQAARYGIYLLAGSLPVREKRQDKYFARSLVFDPHGQTIGSYDKIHLFDVDLSNGESYHESSNYNAGENSPQNTSVLSVSNARFGLTICYDLRFPELYRRLTHQGAQIITVPAAFTYATGEAHWQTLLRARAIENQVYIMAAAQVGKHANGRRTWGHSMIIDPWGTVIAELPAKTGLLVAEIDLARQKQIRTDFPVLQHRHL